MNGITHKQAGRYMRADLDGLLTAAQSRDLTAHLDECEACRLESESLSALTARLQNGFHARWDTQHGPSTHVMANIKSQSRRIIMSKRIDLAFNILGGVATLLVLFFVVTSVISQFQKNTTAASGTQVVRSSPQDNARLLAFTSEKDDNAEIYTMHGDGSALTNLTNNPAQDMNPIWSPDGKHIVFESDRTGFKQIYLMNSDGSNIVQLTTDDVDHQLPITYHNQFTIWSPDGKEILFLQNDQDGKTWTLSSLNINGENKNTLLTSDTRQFVTASWSPNGNYIGLALFDEPEPDHFLPNIYVVDADGNNLREIKKFLPQEEQIFAPYFWSSDGQSVIFPANKYKPFRETIYELRLNDNTLTTLATVKPSLFDWQDGITLIIDANKESQPLVWLRPDGTTTELDLQKGKNPASCYIDRERSSRGNLAIGSYCKADSKVLLYWTNADGSNIQQLPAVEVPVVNGGLTGLTLSPDEKFVTFNFETDNKTDLYIWNMEDALRDSSVQPTKLLIGNKKLRYIPAWQPLAEDIAGQKPTPEPEKASSSTRLIAYVSDTDGNAEIYTMHADGSYQTNLTNHSAHDVNPIWSPDGKHILFESNRIGFNQIYSMNADGSNLTQLTSEKADYAIGTKYGNTPEPWSPDGKKIVYSQRFSTEDTNLLYVMDADGSNKIALTSDPGMYTFLGWSPDGKKIVYQDQQFEGRIRIVDNNGTNYIDGPFFEGDKSRRHSQIYWETPEQFIALSSNSEQSTWGPWNITRFFTTGDYTNYNGSNPILVTSNSPIVAVFDKTYVFEDQNSLTWFTYEGAPIPLAPWKFNSVCEKPGDPLLLDSAHRMSPDGKHLFVIVTCNEGISHFYLVNADGSEITELASMSTPISWQALDTTWSPDGKYVIMTSAVAFPNNQSAYMDFYLFDIEKMLNDPSTKPVQLTTDGAFKFGAVWQPKP